ncbi:MULTISPECIES: hypothetical protein [Halobacterium]|uniref:hypothetical protein n=1 Tax=Halobacterium TaxID=2239 RepID=UPI001966BD2C|nr:MULTISPECIES: hypothetical protein [Halobacterium]MCF2167482.1 hypothetical protein [Halobacterium salinarum]MCF2238827.1 hypothetical protein [Halobacterium salinarum]QRY21930.1 hypothetical protein JT689_07820 [Halobacterium sp. GSL-19]WJK63320.2 hypothetical protein QSJ49_08815 [Halobacterium salinarum]
MATGASTFAVGTTGAAENPDEAEVNAEQSNATIERAREAIQTEYAEKLISGLSLYEFGLKKDLSNANKIHGMIDNNEIVLTISIPFSAGELFVHYRENRPFKAIVRLEDEELQQKFDWTAAESGVVYAFADGEETPIIGTRSVTSAQVLNQVEQVTKDPQDTVEFTELDEGSTDSETKKSKISNEETKVTIISDSEIYVGNADNPRQITQSSPKLTTQGCDEELVACGASLFTAAPTCAVIAAGCSATGVTAVPCAIAVINTCLPGVAVSLPACTGIDACL